MKFSRFIATIGLVAGLSAGLSGCAVFNTASDSRFACEENDDCPTPLEVYAETHTSPIEIEMGRTPADWKSGARDDENNKKRDKDFMAQRAIELAQINSSSLIMAGGTQLVKPLREPSQVIRIWIAPWIDNNDNLNWPSYVFTEITQRRWGFGEQEIRHFGMPMQALPQWRNDGPDSLRGGLIMK